MWPQHRCRLKFTVVVALYMCVSAAPASPQMTARDHYREAVAAREAKDYKEYLQNITAALAQVPGHAVLLRHVAAAHALMGQSDEAVSTLRRLTATGAYFDISGYDEFAPLRTLSSYKSVERMMENNLRPLGLARVALRIPDPRLIPEGIAYDPVRDAFFVSSVHKRKILQVTRTGQVSDFSAGQADYFGGLGMKVDAERRRLWAVSAAFEGMKDFHPDLDGYSSISCFDLDTGKRVFHRVLTNEVGKHSLNDLELEADGGLYVTDSASGALYHLAPGADSLTTFLPAGTLRGPNGIALDEKRGLLYVSQWGWDVVSVEIATRSVTPLRRPDNVAMYAVDGLYFIDGDLVAIQNDASLVRVVRFYLERSGTRVISARILAKRLEMFDEPTTGVIVGGEFYFIANSQIERFVRSGEDPSTPFQDVLILAISL